MACMGPDRNFAVKRSEEAYDEIMMLLKEKYNVDRPPVLGNAPGFEARIQDEWNKRTEQLKAVLTEIVWTSDAGSW